MPIRHTTFSKKYQHGCYGGRDSKDKSTQIHVDCADENADGKVLTPLPESFKPLVLNADMDTEWFDLVKNFKTSGRPKKN